MDNLKPIDVRLREWHKNSGCDWTVDNKRCRQSPNVAVTAKEAGQGLLTFCAEHAPLMSCPMLFIP